MSAPQSGHIDDISSREKASRDSLQPVVESYQAVVDALIELAGDMLNELTEGPPHSEHAVALILARVATEARAVFHLTSIGYPMQAFTIVGTMLELMHTAAYIGGDNDRANEYFEHTNRKQAYPGGVKKMIAEVGADRGLTQEALDREYDNFYTQVCLVKHGNPMAMSVGTDSDDDTLYIVIGPAQTSASLRMTLATMQQAVRYILLTVTVFLLHHASGERAEAWNRRVTAESDRWQELNQFAQEMLEVPPMEA
jgi:hypothetical protein